MQPLTTEEIYNLVMLAREGKETEIYCAVLSGVYILTLDWTSSIDKDRCTITVASAKLSNHTRTIRSIIFSLGLNDLYENYWMAWGHHRRLYAKHEKTVADEGFLI